jgi:hypothetical protein
VDLSFRPSRRHYPPLKTPALTSARPLLSTLPPSRQLFQGVEASAASACFSVRAQFLEIYNEEVRDLLAPGPGAGAAPAIAIREAPDGQILVTGMCVCMCRQACVTEGDGCGGGGPVLLYVKHLNM